MTSLLAGLRRHPTREQHLRIPWAGEPELARLRKRAASSHRGAVKHPAELITSIERC